MHQSTKSNLFDNRSSLVVCIVCALEEEAQAFLRMAEEHYHLAWTNQVSSQYKYSYRLSTLANENREHVNIHLSWLPRYGSNEMLLHLSHVIEEYQPCFAIMTGICAGDRQHVRLGDLIVAERVFSYDTGKMVKGEQEQIVHLHDTMTYQLHENTLQFLHSFNQWKPLVATFSRPASKRQQRDWLLERLLSEPTASVKAIPRAELEKSVPAWRELVQELQQGPQPFLSPAPERALLDKSMIEDMYYGRNPFPFQDPAEPRCYIRPLASGRAVRSDNPFKDIQIPVRGAVAIDMEGDAFVRVMETERFRSIEWLIVKGVSDYADQDKDDSYHTYASQAAAVYALCFTKAYVTQERFPLASEGLLSSDKQKEGILALERGAKALLNADYASARKHLRVAIDEIDPDQQKKEAAQSRYLNMLAILGYERPQDKGTTARETMSELLSAAIRLDRCEAYIMTRALILDPSLPRQVYSPRVTTYDRSLLDYVRRCQPNLYQRISEAFGI